jgi:2-hydroxychromene-2-carboxylate isomerase
MQVDFYYAIDSRYSYLAATQLPGLEAEFGIHIGWKPLQFDALMKARGDHPYDGRPRNGQYDPAYRNTDAHRWANYYQVPLVEPDWDGIWDRIALAAVAAQRLDAGEAMSFALFAAVMQDRATPKNDADIARIAGQAGLDGDKIVAAIDEPETVELHQQHLKAALSLGVFGVPSFVVGNDVFWGNDRIVLLRHRLNSRVLL